MSRGPTHFSSDEEGEDVLVTEAHYLPGANFLSYTPVISNTHFVVQPQILLLVMVPR